MQFKSKSKQRESSLPAANSEARSVYADGLVLSDGCTKLLERLAQYHSIFTHYFIHQMLFYRLSNPIFSNKIGLMVQDWQDYPMENGPHPDRDLWWLPLGSAVLSGSAAGFLVFKQEHIALGALTGALWLVILIAMMRLLKVNVEEDVLGKV